MHASRDQMRDEVHSRMERSVPSPQPLCEGEVQTIIMSHTTYVRTTTTDETDDDTTFQQLMIVFCDNKDLVGYYEHFDNR